MSIRKLSPELQRKAEEELNEVPGRIQEDLKYIRDWINKQPHLNARQDDQWLISFLRGCKFSLERTKEKLDCFYMMRTLVPEYYADRNPYGSEIQEILKKGCFWVPLPKCATPSSSRILVLNTKNSDNVNMITVMKVNLMILEILLMEDDNFVVAGHHILQDMKDLSMNSVLQINGSFIRKTAICFLRAFPGRPKGLYFINAPSIFEIIFNVMNSIPREKVRARMCIRSSNDCSDLSYDITQDILPDEFGGVNGSIQKIKAEWKSKIEGYADWFKEDAQYFSNEKKRPGKPTNAEELFGLDGSFRKLNID